MSRRHMLKGAMALWASVALRAPSIKAQIPDNNEFILNNEQWRATISIANGVCQPIETWDTWNQKPQTLAHLWQCVLADGRMISPQDCTLVKASAPTKGAVQLEWDHPMMRITSQWYLPDEAHYFQQLVTLSAKKQDVHIDRVILHQLSSGEWRETGSVKGCPLVNDHLFAAIEHPLSESEVSADGARIYMSRELPLRAKQSVSYRAVVGSYRPTQLRRDFQRYVEAERARPYQPFLHYNSWYDLCFSDIRFTAQQAVQRVQQFIDILSRRFGVTLKSFLMDDGWDDPKTLWQFHEGFPEGFTPVRAAAKEIDAAPGVWMSPWGGYGNEKLARMEYGAKQGFEMNQDGFALSGPKYFQRFRESCLKMIREYGVNQFKIDGMGNVNRAVKGSAFDSDFDAAIQLIKDIRHENPDIYINLTYGTFPSPFWLWHADSIWRGGNDHDFVGAGTKRQQWITYRDADTYDNVVRKSELFPLNSLMLHGIILAQHTKHLAADPFGDFDAEVRSFFGSGTQCQELYLTPDLLSDRHWQAIAAGAKFSDAYRDILKDAHWVGGNPRTGEVYGWAAWSDNHQGILTLRNPDSKAHVFEHGMAELFELAESASRYRFTELWVENAETMELGTKTALSIAPYEVKSWLVVPAS